MKTLPPPPTASSSAADWFAGGMVSIAVGAAAGAFAGFVWGGVFGRLAMRLLFLTSPDRVRGVTSDDGFTIGQISFDTIGLLIITTIAGFFFGALYGAVRMVTAGSITQIALGVTVGFASFGGASIVHTDGVDFNLLRPLWLAVGLFVLLPGLWGVTVVPLTERLVHGTGILRRMVSEEELSQIDCKRWGAIGWLVLLAMTMLGVIDLVGDISKLRR